MINKKCIICGSPNCKIFPNKFFKNVLLLCQKCGLIFVEPQPQFSELKKIYSQNYFKSEDFFTLFKSTVKDSLALIQIDFNQDGEASAEEKRDSVSYTRLTR